MAKLTNEEVLAAVKLAVARRVTAVGTILPAANGHELCDENDMIVYVRAEGDELIAESADGRRRGRFKVTYIGE